MHDRIYRVHHYNEKEVVKRGVALMEIKISDAVHYMYTYVTVTIALERDAFSFEDLRRFTEVERCKSLHFEKETLPLSLLGFVKAFPDRDLIVIRAGMEETLAQVATLHEIAHLLLNHPPAPTQTYEEWVQGGRKHEESDSKRTHNNEDICRENDAEALATLLRRCILRKKAALPEGAKDIYGWKN